MKLLTAGFLLATIFANPAIGRASQEPDELADAVNGYIGCALPEAIALEPSGEPLSVIVRAALFACSSQKAAVEKVIRERAEIALVDNPRGDVDRSVRQLMQSTDERMTDRLNLDLLRIRADRANEN